jgi:hypothetical protein
VAHQERQDIVGFFEMLELMGFLPLATEHLRQVFARHHDVKACDQGGEESIKFLDIHGASALAVAEELLETGQFGLRQRLVLGRAFH